MADLIDRQAVIDVITEYADRLQMVNWRENPGVPYKAYTLNWCVNTIRDLPSADVQPVRHGHWIDTNGRKRYPFWVRYECSECGAKARDYRFCPHCGARMDGET